jgi:hypothetical protein
MNFESMENAISNHINGRNNEYNDLKKDDIPTNIFRFKFSEEFVDILSQFSKVHQYDNRHDFKKSWNDWIKDNEEPIYMEIRRLNNYGYDGDILDKMFKSARYYFRKKSTEKKEPKERRVYISVSKEFLDKIDEHILKNIKNDDYKPSTGFEHFCKNNIDVLRDEIKRICVENFTSKEIQDKFKKTYKNRYFILTNKK